MAFDLSAFDRQLARDVEARYGGVDAPEWIVCMRCGTIEQDPSDEEVKAANDTREEGEGRPELPCAVCAAWDATQPASNPQGPDAEGIGMSAVRWITEAEYLDYLSDRHYA